MVDVRTLEVGKSQKKQLTAKQNAFVAEYLIDLNATQAALRAGYSKKTAEVKGSQLLSLVKVSEVVEEALAKRQARTEITQDKVLDNIVRIGGKAEDKERFSDALKAEEMLARHVRLFSDPDDDKSKEPPSVTYNFITVQSG